MRGRMKIAESPIPIWTKEWDKIGQFARWEISVTSGPSKQRVEQTGTKSTLKAIMPIKKIKKSFFPEKSICRCNFGLKGPQQCPSVVARSHKFLLIYYRVVQMSNHAIFHQFCSISLILLCPLAHIGMMRGMKHRDPEDADDQRWIKEIGHNWWNLAWFDIYTMRQYINKNLWLRPTTDGYCCGPFKLKLQR